MALPWPVLYLPTKLKYMNHQNIGEHVYVMLCVYTYQSSVSTVHRTSTGMCMCGNVYNFPNKAYIYFSVCIIIAMQSPHSLSEMVHLKLILLGNNGVGKTSLMYRFLHGTYDDTLSATVSLLYCNSFVCIYAYMYTCIQCICMHTYKYT